MIDTVSRADPAPGRGVVLYDGACEFCRRSVGLLRRLDWLGRLHFQNCRDSDTWPPCDEPLEMPKLIEEMHVVPPERDRSLAGFQAFRWMAWRMPLVLPLAPLLYLPGVLWLGNRVYRWVARNRFQLVPCGTGECQVPLKRASEPAGTVPPAG